MDYPLDVRLFSYTRLLYENENRTLRCDSTIDAQKRKGRDLHCIETEALLSLPRFGAIAAILQSAGRWGM